MSILPNVTAPFFAENFFLSIPLRKHGPVKKWPSGLGMELNYANGSFFDDPFEISSQLERGGHIVQIVFFVKRSKVTL